VTLALAATAGYLAFIWEDHIVILATSLIGAYLFIRGISIFAGGFPNEITLYQEISEGTASFSDTFIGYLVGIGALFALGVFVQEKTKGHYEHHDHFHKTH